MSGMRKRSRTIKLHLRWQLRRFLRHVRRMSGAIMLSLLLVACVGLGGASRNNQALWVALEFLALATLAAVLLLQRPLVLPRPGVIPLILVAAFIAVPVLQLVPLPWGVWSSLPGHGLAADGLRLLGLAETSHPLSLSPDRTVSALLKCLPPLGVFVLALLVPRRSLLGLVSWGLPVLGLAATGLGLAQLLLGSRLNLHLYDWTNVTLASGPFANVNHQATFLLMCMPFAAILATSSRWERNAGGFETFVVRVVPVAILTLGVIMTFSGAGLLMTPMVLIGCLMMARRRPGRLEHLVPGGALLATLAAMMIALLGSTLQEAADYGSAERSRMAIYSHTADAIGDFLPLGSGLGTFDQVYPTYEDPAAIEPTYVNHAHNEYLEIILELGAPGFVILILFVVWWIRTSHEIWLSSSADRGLGRAAKAASVALAAVLIHALLDYPLRTPALASLAALCAAVMIQAQGRSYPSKTSGQQGAPKEAFTTSGTGASASSTHMKRISPADDLSR